jgi:hypothetical protein
LAEGPGPDIADIAVNAVNAGIGTRLNRLGFA